MVNKFIPYGRQWVDDEDIKSVVEVLKSDYLTTGPKIEEFEKKFADYVGAKYAVAVASGTAALHAACFAAGIKEKDEVITSPMTFAASANCILYQRGIPVFADIDSDTYNIAPKEIRKKITDKTAAIIPVDYGGQPCNLAEIQDIAKEHGLMVIEDAAHALGATYKGKMIGGLSDLTIFSFHPVKLITTGEGGMVTTNSYDLYEKLIQFRTHGITKDSSKFIFRKEAPWYQEQQFLGYNYRMTEIQAALGISQLKKITKFLKRRREIAHFYNQELKDIDWLKLPYQKDKRESSWHLYVVQVLEERLGKNREDVFNYLTSKGLGVQVHYIPVYWHPYYQKLGYKKGICPIAEEFYGRAISLPIYPKMEDKDVEMVISIFKEINF